MVNLLLMRLTTLVLIAFFLAILPAQAGGPRIITLKDGSRINGQITGIENGQYVVQSPSFGQIKVTEDNVASIVDASQTAPAPVTAPQATPPPSANPGAYTPQIQAAQAQIISNPEVMSDIQQLTTDPEIMATLSDQTFISEVQSHNYEGMQSNPSFQKLLNNPRMQALMQKLMAGQQQPQPSGQ